MMRFLIAIVLIAFGILIGITTNIYLLLTLDKSINVIDLATLLATFFLTIYIPVFLDKHMQNKRYEKEVIIRKIEDLQISFKRVNNLVTECIQKGVVSQTNCYHIINTFTSISSELESLITLIEYCNSQVVRNEIEKLKKFRREYKDIVTGGEFQNRNFSYTALVKKDEEVLYNKIDKELCLLILKINRF
jgi:hypothetical protein